MVEQGSFITLRLAVDSLTRTNPFLDQRWLHTLIDSLESGTVKPEELKPLLVSVIVDDDGQLLGYCVLDGNHSYEALKRTGATLVDVHAAVSDNSSG